LSVGCQYCKVTGGVFFSWFRIDVYKRVWINATVKIDTKLFYLQILRKKRTKEFMTFRFLR
jgi:hypothetical protein